MHGQTLNEPDRNLWKVPRFNGKNVMEAIEMWKRGETSIHLDDVAWPFNTDCSGLNRNSVYFTVVVTGTGLDENAVMQPVLDAAGIGTMTQLLTATKTEAGG